MNNEEIFNVLFKSAEATKVVAHAKLASILIYKRSVVSFGFNQMKTHPLQFKFGKNKKSVFLHSEIDCIKNAIRYIDPEDFNKSSLYTLRIKRSGRGGDLITGMSLPCEGCMKAILSFGIKNVYYTEENSRTFTCLENW